MTNDSIVAFSTYYQQVHYALVTMDEVHWRLINKFVKQRAAQYRRNDGESASELENIRFGCRMCTSRRPAHRLLRSLAIA